MNGKVREESGFKISFPITSSFAFIDFDELKTRFASFYRINNTPASCDFVCMSLDQDKCDLIEAKSLASYADIQRGIERLKVKLPKKFVDTLFVLTSIVGEKEKGFLLRALWDKGIVYYLLVTEEKTPEIIKVIETLERKISDCLKACGLKVTVSFATTKEIQKKISRLSGSKFKIRRTKDE